MMLLAVLLDLSGTIIELRPTDVEGARAEVTVQNFQLNGPHDNGEYPLTLGDLTVIAQFVWEIEDEGADGVIVTPPDGFICQPIDCTAVVPEGTSGRVVIFEWAGM